MVLKKEKTLFIILTVGMNSLLANQTLLLSETDASYNIDNGNYHIVISKETGMIESLNLTESGFELVSDGGYRGAYSMFFPEYVFEGDDGKWGWMHYPGENPKDINIEVILNTSDAAIVKVSWITNYIDSYWSFIFCRGSPLFRASIKRKVIRTGVYSNAQQCVMYSPDMDESYLVDYEGQLLLTMGEGNSNSYLYRHWNQENTSDASPWTSTHSLWTVFDYGIPRFFPTLVWRNTQNNITVGVITTWSSPEQRSTISYHGGGATHSHPGFAEGQWNWFGKSDSESLYLLEGTEYSMELIYYQDYGHVDSLWKFVEDRLNNNAFRYIESEEYSIASWGGRTSIHDRYFWRFPQVSNNYITSQRLFRPNSFAIPRSQNGLRNNHLFSLFVKGTINGNKIDLTPNYGHSPLFDSLKVSVSDSGWTGGMSWKQGGLKTWLYYHTLGDNMDVMVSGSITLERDIRARNLYLQLNFSPRLERCEQMENHLWELWGIDSILDTIGIALYQLRGFQSTEVLSDQMILSVFDSQKDTMLAAGTQFSYSMKLHPHHGHRIKSMGNLYDSQTSSENHFKSYFYQPNSGTNQRELFIEPSTKYYILSAYKYSVGFIVDIWIEEKVNEIYFYSDNLDINSALDLNTGKGISVIADGNPGVKGLMGQFSQGRYKVFLSKGEEFIKPLISLYPNPSGGILHMRIFSGFPFEGYFNLYNILGRTVFSKRLSVLGSGVETLTIILPKERLPSGVYFTKMTTPLGTYKNKVFLIK